MSSGQFLDMAQRAARGARYDPSDTTDLTRAKESVNTAYLAACEGGIQFDFLEQEGAWALTAGSDVYAYSSIATAMSLTGATIAEIIAISVDTVNDGDVLRSMDWLSLERLAISTQDGEQTGQPLWWAKWDSRIRLFPAPDIAYTLGCLVRLAPTEMSADTDTPLVPLAYRNSVIVPWATADLLRQEGGGEAHNEAQLWQRQGDNAWQNMRTAHATARPPTFRLKSPGWDRPFGQSQNWDRSLGWF